MNRLVHHSLPLALAVSAIRWPMGRRITTPRCHGQPSATIRGSWPQARMKAMRSAAAIEVVARVAERMAVDAVGIHHRGIEDDGDAPGGVIDEAEGGDRTRLDAQDLGSSISGLAEGQAAPSRSAREGVFRSTRRVLEADDKPESLACLSLRNRFLQWPPGMCAAQAPGLLDGENRRDARSWLAAIPSASRRAEQILRCGGAWPLLLHLAGSCAIRRPLASERCDPTRA